MGIPFINSKKTSPTALTIGEKASTSKSIASPSDRTSIELIRMDEYSAVAGGPQISNHPPT